MTLDPFRVDTIPRSLRPAVEAALGVRKLRELYRNIRQNQLNPSDRFERRVLEALDISPSVTSADLASIPTRGPVVIVANHPHGALDGLLLLDVVRQLRPDVRVLANRVLERIPELQDSCFFVDPFDGPKAAARSRAGLRAAHLWLRHGGALVVFPAGEAGHSWVDGSLVDGPWKATFERLAAASGAKVVAAFIEGRNSRAFYAAGRVHPRLRTALMGRELLNKRGRAIRVTLGARDEIANEIAKLGDDACLVESGSFRVFCVTADAIPSTLQEIGRLRELTFQAAGEGTGRTIDLDTFDQEYLHLFVWDRDKRQVVGAYRIRSFVRAEYQKNYNALLLLWRGIGAFVARHPQYRYLFGTVSISARYSDTSHAMLVEFLRQNHLDRDLADLVDAITPRLPTRAIGRALPGSIDDLNRLIAEYEGDGKGIPVLLRQYLKLNARLLGVNIDRGFGDVVDALMIVDLTTVSPTILQRYLGRLGSADFVRFHEHSRSTRAA